MIIVVKIAYHGISRMIKNYVRKIDSGKSEINSHSRQSSQAWAAKPAPKAVSQ
jgi:hypothetical protein